MNSASRVFFFLSSIYIRKADDHGICYQGLTRRNDDSRSEKAEI